MDIGEMIERMQRMRKSVKEHNIYWWAGSLIGDLCDLRLKKTKTTKATKASISKKATKES